MSFYTVLLQTGDLAGTDNQQMAEGVDELTREIPVWDLVLMGGWTMIPLAILSVMTIYIFVERFLMIQKALKDERNFMTQVKAYLIEGKLTLHALCVLKQIILLRACRERNFKNW
jgi:biopolymer transport protein ExbB